MSDIPLFNKQAFPWVNSDSYFDDSVLYPKLSIVVPSYNQADYLEETLLSIIHQNYPCLELIVIDGGSTDHSVEIIKKYEQYISYWVSEKDGGQSHAINKGFEKATGKWLAWMNSDDCYLEGALHTIFTKLPHIDSDFIFGYCSVGETFADSIPQIHTSGVRKNLEDILLFFYNVRYIIPSQSVFVRKSLVDKVGLLDESLHYCMDLDWYARLYSAKPRLFEYPFSLSFFRINSTTKTGSQQIKMQNEAIELALKYSVGLDSSKIARIKSLVSYHSRFILSNLYTENTSVFNSIKVFANTPREAFVDTRFWGNLKKVLVSW